MYYPICGMVHIKEPLLLIGVAYVAAAGFLSRYLSGCSLNDNYTDIKQTLCISASKRTPKLQAFFRSFFCHFFLKSYHFMGNIASSGAFSLLNVFYDLLGEMNGH